MSAGFRQGAGFFLKGSKQMTYSLWVDDQADELPARKVPEGWVGAKSSSEAIAIVQEKGPPEWMDLDHDLGGSDTVLVFLRWLRENHFNDIPRGCRVHSQNPIGADAIRHFMHDWKREIEFQQKEF
jgi:hypothetical protein